MKLVLDTNVYLSAFIFPGGNAEKIIGLVRAGTAVLFVSPDILTEFTAVLKRKFSCSEKSALEFRDRILAIATLVYPKERLKIITACEPDNRILECAHEARADFLVSGDKKHILPVKKLGKTRILSLREFLLKMDADD